MLRTLNHVSLSSKVDIKCVTPGTGGYYYKDHLQRLGEVPQRKKGIPKTGKVKTSEEETLHGIRKLQVGDNARVTLPVDGVKLLIETDGCAGWNDDTKPVSLCWKITRKTVRQCHTYTSKHCDSEYANL